MKEWKKSNFNKNKSYLSKYIEYEFFIKNTFI
jgi:hypothetical protein